MVLCAAAAPLNRQFDIFSFLPGILPPLAPPPATDPVPMPTPIDDAPGGDGGDGLGIGTFTSIGENATVIGGVAPGSGVADLGDGSTATFIGVSTGIGIGGAGGR
eukprot:TRINITY_DN5005_c0_g1_i1.p2 TRINITY_DN5005_c0_g1~~TRINITY_DN5005_c0_g1_i1.p2  ORF type:complete len:105 (-),score=14.94 TRINITY_DN5005_c0_g1_i1:147-461(-)